MRNLILGLIVLGSFSCQRNLKEPFQTGLENQPIPTFSIMLSDSTTFTKLDTVSSKGDWILFYYSPTCPYCRAQMREMIRNVDRFKGMPIYAVTTSDITSMRKFIKEFKLNRYANFRSGIDTGNVLIKDFKVPGVPFTAIVTNQRKLKVAYLGKTAVKTLIKDNIYE